MNSPAIEGFTCAPFAYAGYEYPVYKAGQGPAVVVVHENPGVTPAVIRFARFVVDAGFTVYMPSLFGTVGRGYDVRNLAKQVVMACIRKEFATLVQGRSSPVTDFLRGLCRHAHAECGGVGVGAIGMCLTGNFALSLMVEPVVKAPVLSQPSLPAGFTHAARSDLHISPTELATIKQRVADEDLQILGLRFTGDILCPKARFERLRAEFGDNFEGIEIDSSLGNPYGNPLNAHSVLTLHLIDREGHPTRQALDRTLGFFKERLLVDAPAV